MRSIHFSQTATAAALCALLTAALAPQAWAQDSSASASVTIPVKLTQRLSSDSVKAGDRFTFATTQSVTIGDTNLPAGTTGHGVVGSVRKASLEHGGELALQVQTLDLPDGRTIPVTAAHGPQAEKHSVVTQAAQTAQSVAASATKPMNALETALVPLSVPVRGIIMLGSALHMLKGHNVVFGSGTTFSVVAAVPPSPEPT